MQDVSVRCIILDWDSPQGRQDSWRRVLYMVSLKSTYFLKKILQHNDISSSESFQKYYKSNNKNPFWLYLRAIIIVLNCWLVHSDKRYSGFGFSNELLRRLQFLIYKKVFHLNKCVPNFLEIRQEFGLPHIKSKICILNVWWNFL